MSVKSKGLFRDIKTANNFFHHPVKANIKTANNFFHHPVKAKNLNFNTHIYI